MASARGQVHRGVMCPEKNTDAGVGPRTLLSQLLGRFLIIPLCLVRKSEDRSKCLAPHPHTGSYNNCSQMFNTWLVDAHIPFTY